MTQDDIDRSNSVTVNNNSQTRPPAWRPATVLALAAALSIIGLGWWVVATQALGRGSAVFALATFVVVALVGIVAANANGLEAGSQRGGRGRGR